MRGPLWLWAIVAVIGPLLACACPENAVILTEFEEMCGEVPCGWTLEEGSVEQAPTFHPAIQGARLEAGSLLSYDGAPDALSYDVLVRCEGTVDLIVAGERVEHSRELYEWTSAMADGRELTIEVIGTSGHCIVDDVAYVPDCEGD